MSQISQDLQALLDKLPARIAKKIKKFLSDSTNSQTIGLWSSALVASIVAVAYAQVFRIFESQFHQLFTENEYAPFVASPLLFLIAWWIVYRFAPEASGSGIPQIMAANEIEYKGKNQAHVDRLLSLRTAVVKVISSLLCVLGGGAIGREGPTLQISTSVFHFFGRGVRRFSPQTDEHIWVVAGAAAGLASAFNTPLGGIVYAIEELGLVHFHKIRTALLSGVIVAGLVAQWVLGSYLYLGFPELSPVDFTVIPAAIFNGAITGLLGAAFSRILFYFLRKRLAISKLTSLALLTVICGLAIAGLTLIDGRASGSGLHVITGFLFHKENPSLELVGLRFFGTIISYLSGAAGGIFSPSLAIGATAGAYFSQFVASDHANLMVLLGMIGFLTGVTRTPFTSFILVLEMTDRHVAIFPMMLTALAAQSFAHLITNHSFYENVKQRYIPVAVPSSG